jgi:hypothetical protein
VTMPKRQLSSRDPSYRPFNRLPPEKVAEILEALKAHSNASVVARQVGGTSHVTVWRYAKAAGIKLDAGKAVQRRARKPAEKRKQIIAAVKAEIIAALKVKPNAGTVARQVDGVSHINVSKVAEVHGIRLDPGRAAFPTEKRDQIIAALKANPNASEVARDSGVSSKRVYGIAKAAGIELPGGKTAMPIAKREQIIAALRANPNATAVARKTGVSFKTGFSSFPRKK